MDTYSTEAMKSYKDLMDLGMNVEVRHSGKLFEVASSMLKNAVEAKNAKLEKKLRIKEEKKIIAPILNLSAKIMKWLKFLHKFLMDQNK